MSGERSCGDVEIIDVDGRVTHSSGFELGERVRTLVSKGHHKILLNLQRVTYVDSAGLGAIIEAYTSTSRHGGALKVLSLQTRVWHLFRISGLLSIIETFESEAKAVASFGTAPSAPKMAQ